ncbi:MAG: T9SS type A sorting domain-containing protein [Bacteroidia bacterium]|nr:T9SS type A sorting domain-containing protein [Bacteroidia bacterium]
MKKLILIFLIPLALNLNSQIAYSWARQTGGTSTEDSQCIASDASGNVYIAGSFQGTVDFDPGAGTTTLVSAGSDDAFISKFDANGNFIAVYTFTNNLFCKIFGITIDNGGNIITTGAFSGSVDFDPGVAVNAKTSNGLNDIFVCKLSSTGTFMWVKAIGSFGSDDFGVSVTTDVSANVLVTGYFQGTNVNFDVGASNFAMTAFSGKDVFVLKLNSGGVFTWAIDIGGSGTEVGQTIKTDGSGNVYLGGYFGFTVDFDPGAGTANLTSAGGNDAFIAKYTSSGIYVWVKKFSGGLDEVCYSISVNSAGDIYSTGTFQSTTDFDPDAGTFNLGPSNTNDDIFVSKLNSTGAFVWAKKFGGSAVDFGTSISVDASGVYTTGYYAGTADFDPSTTSVVNLVATAGSDFFISKLDLNGNYIFAKSIGGSGNDIGRAIITPSTDLIYTTGAFNTIADFDISPLATSNLTSVGSTDAFLLKLIPCPLQTPTVVASSTLICSGYTSSLSVIGAVNYTWSTGATTSVIAVTPSITTGYSVSGMYTNGCVNTGSINIQVSACTGTDEHSISGGIISVFPNPNSGVFTLRAATAGKLMVVNSLGQLVDEIYVNEGSQKINISLGAGIYYLIDKHEKIKIVIAN